MHQMNFVSPKTVSGAIKLLAEYRGKSKVLAGGTDLLVQLRMGKIQPKVIIDIKNIKEANQITIEKKGVRIGAAVSGAVVGECDHIKSNWPGVVEALELIGSTQIQGRASLGGNLCNGSPAADSVPALIANEAICRIAGPNGKRDIKVQNFVKSPGKTILKRDEMLTSLFLPNKPVKSSSAYLRLIPRTEMDIAVVGAAAFLTLDKNNKCLDAVVCLGAVAPKATIVKTAKRILVGNKINNESLTSLVMACENTCDPINDARGTVTYRTKVAGVLARRAVQIAHTRILEKGNL